MLPTLILPLLIFLHLVLARVVINSPDDLPSTTFDIVVVGGGLTGLAIAGRLSERDPKLSVLVVEAGTDNRTSPDIQSLLKPGRWFNGPQDWAWQVDKGRVLRGGKTLGGSSSINGALWTRGHAAQVDRYARLFPPSSSSWSYHDLAKYMARSETFHGPTASQHQGINATFDPRVHGFHGPVQAAFPNSTLLADGPGQNEYIKSCENALGLEKGQDQATGNPTGIWVVPQSIDPARGDNRSSSAEAYLTPVEDSQENWTVLVEHMVTKILFSAAKGQDGLLLATGIEFGAADGTGRRFIVRANKEVILAAGAIQTPALLQLSGVGSPATLSPLGIKPILPLPGVGRNLQDQPLLSFNLSTNIPSSNSSEPWSTVDHIADALVFLNITHLFGNATKHVGDKIYANVTRWVEGQTSREADVDSMAKVLNVEAQSIVQDGTPILEIHLYTPADGTLLLPIWTLLPFSRGNVTLNSTDPFQKPNVHVGYLNVDFDLQVLVAGAQAVRKVISTPPLSDLIVGETTPGLAAVPAGDSPEADAAWREYIMENFAPTYHPLGTAAMLPRELNGVVDERLKVYGTANLRIVDGSVIPFQMPAHPSATLYGVAEKAADMILEDLLG